MTITEIRARFPNPRSAQGDFPETCDYCVGGAIYLSVSAGAKPIEAFGYHSRFPSTETLAAGLHAHNPRLTAAAARRFAGAIIETNDREAFEMAWAVAQAALEADKEA